MALWRALGITASPKIKYFFIAPSSKNHFRGLYVVQFRFNLVEVVGIAPLAARPAPTLSTSSFAFHLSHNPTSARKAFYSRKTAPTLNSPHVRAIVQKEKPPI